MVNGNNEGVVTVGGQKFSVKPEFQKEFIEKQRQLQAGKTVTEKKPMVQPVKVVKREEAKIPISEVKTTTPIPKVEPRDIEEITPGITEFATGRIEFEPTEEEKTMVRVVPVTERELAKMKLERRIEEARKKPRVTQEISKEFRKTLPSGIKTEQKDIVREFARAGIETVLTTPTAAAVGTEIIFTEPEIVGSVIFKSITEVPKQFIERPITTLGSILGPVILFGGLGKLTPRPTFRGSVSKGMKITPEIKPDVPKPLTRSGTIELISKIDEGVVETFGVIKAGKDPIISRIRAGQKTITDQIFPSDIKLPPDITEARIFRVKTKPLETKSDTFVSDFIFSDLQQTRIDNLISRRGIGKAITEPGKFKTDISKAVFAEQRKTGQVTLKGKKIPQERATEIKAIDKPLSETETIQISGLKLKESSPLTSQEFIKATKFKTEFSQQTKEAIIKRIGFEESDITIRKVSGIDELPIKIFTPKKPEPITLLPSVTGEQTGLKMTGQILAAQEKAIKSFVTKSKQELKPFTTQAEPTLKPTTPERVITKVTKKTEPTLKPVTLSKIKEELKPTTQEEIQKQIQEQEQEQKQEQSQITKQMGDLRGR